MKLNTLIVPLGRVEGNKLSFYSGYSKEILIFSPNDFTTNNLSVAFGAENLIEHFQKRREKYDVVVNYEAVKDYIIQKCTEIGFLDPSKIRGQGLWK